MSLIGRELIYMLSISIEMLFKEKKKIMSLMLSLIATFVVCIVFIQFFFNPYLIKMTSISHKIAYGSNYILPLDVVNFSDNFAVMTLSIALLIIMHFSYKLQLLLLLFNIVCRIRILENGRIQYISYIVL